MSTILEKANQILAEKQNKILPDNIKAGVQIFDIVGTLKGLDTSDATAIASDIAYGQTAYVNGQKITGTIQTCGAGVNENKPVSLDTNSDTYAEILSSPMRGNVLRVQSTEGIDNLYRATAIHQYDLPVADLAHLIGLTAEIILEGNVILGIEGTGKATEDLQAQLDEQDALIAEQQAKIEELTSLLEDKASNVSTETINNVNEVLGEEGV